MNSMIGNLGEETFIGIDYLEDNLVHDFLEEYKNKKNNFVSNGDERGYTMLSSDKLPTLLVQEYLHFLDGLFLDYAKNYKYIFFTGDNYIRASTPFNFQHYKPGKHYANWHPEQGPPEHNKMFRKAVFITYLNDVLEGGETEFLYYKLRVKPKKGLTLIWPAGFTHVHRGFPAPNEEKLILTGWYVYKNRIFFEQQK